jgi:hypothetical protein
VSGPRGVAQQFAHLEATGMRSHSILFSISCGDRTVAFDELAEKSPSEQNAPKRKLIKNKIPGVDRLIKCKRGNRRSLNVFAAKRLRHFDFAMAPAVLNSVAVAAQPECDDRRHRVPLP